jgi:hypothetical protein
MSLVSGAPQAPQNSVLLFFVLFNARCLNNKLPELIVHCFKVVSSMCCVKLKRGSILQLLIVSCWMVLITQFFVLIVLFRIMVAYAFSLIRCSAASKVCHLELRVIDLYVVDKIRLFVCYRPPNHKTDPIAILDLNDL